MMSCLKSLPWAEIAVVVYSVGFLSAMGKLWLHPIKRQTIPEAVIFCVVTAPIINFVVICLTPLAGAFVISQIIDKKSVGNALADSRRRLR